MIPCSSHLFCIDEEDSAGANETEAEVEEPLPELSLVEIYARRAHKLQQRQAAIAAMSCAVVENPEENVSCSLHSICMSSKGFPNFQNQFFVDEPNLSIHATHNVSL